MLLTSNNLSSEPGIHALVIGVGKYTQAAAYNLDASISSACVSAFEFSNFLLNDLHYPHRPWKSAEVVIDLADDLSDAKAAEIREQLSTFGPWDFQSADFATVYAAVLAWKRRCDESAGDIAFFYFCGHGVEWNGIVALLLRDFNAQTHGFDIGSIDLKAMHKGTAAMKARDKYFFIDSCREAPPSVMDLERIHPAPILPSVDKSHDGVAPIYLAARGSEKAFGRSNECAQFTTSIISSLKGAGATIGRGEHQGFWVVTSNSIADGVDAVLQLKIRYQEGEQQSADRMYPFGAEVLHVLESAQLPAEVDWPPAVEGVIFRAGQTELWRTSGSPPWVDFELNAPPPLPPTVILAFPTPDTAEVGPKPFRCLMVPPVFEYNLW